MFRRATITLGIGPHSSSIIIRPHRSTMYRDAAYSYRPCSVVCRSVSMSVGLSVGLSVTLVSPAKTAEPIKLPFGLRLGWAHGKGQIFGGEWASHCKVYGHSTVVCAKTAEPIGMPLGLWAWMGRRNHPLDAGP